MVIGASLKHYLLEKSRVISQSEGESNYKVFSQLFVGADPSQLASFRLSRKKPHRILSNASDIAALSDPGVAVNKHETMMGPLSMKALDWMELIDSLGTAGFTDADQQDIIIALAVVLHLGDLEFSAESTDGRCTLVDNDAVVDLTALLLVDCIELGNALTTTSNTIRGETIIRPRPRSYCAAARDAIAKGLYDGLFSRIVRTINERLVGNETVFSSTERMGKTKDGVRNQLDISIGILDIFGSVCPKDFVAIALCIH